uniref:NADAR domain-containing protein n=1 Tax=Globodera rostochiensis TaxID=31243 RepID=A0A914HJL4_GLORO
MPNIFDQFANGNKGRSSTVVAARPVDHHSFSRTNVQFDDDIGLPMLDDMASNSTTTTIWDEMEHELRSQVPQDPTPPGNGMQEAELSQEEKRIKLKAIQEELLFTLASRCNGYANLEDLKRDFQIDSGYIAERVAGEHGYHKFEDFANSDLMKSVIKLSVIDGQPTYVPRDCTRFKHIRDEQMVSNDCTVKKEDDEEMEKLARALLPENAEQFIKGKKIILKILYDLGGETSQVLWVRIQEQYKLETGKELAGQELRNLFQRDKAIKILTKYFQGDINVWDTDSGGQYWLQLKRPYREIMQSFDEMIRAQKEAVNRYRTNKRRPHFTSNKAGKPLKLTLEERFPPANSLFTPQIDQSVFLEQGTSKSVAKPPPKSTGPVYDPRAVDDDIGLELPPTNHSINKPKFQIPSDAIKPKLDGTGNNSSPNQKSAQKTGFDWDGDSLTHYDEDVDQNQKTNAKSSSSSKANVNNKKKVKGIAYTSRDKGTYTDSEEEADNDDDARSDVTLMPRKDLPQNEGGSRRRAAFDDVLNEPPTSNNQTNTFAADDRPNGPNPVGHQKNIQKYMKTLMEQKGPIPNRPPNSSIFNSGQVTSDRKQPLMSSADDKNVVDNMETDISVAVPPGGVPDGHSQSDKRQAPNCGPNFESFPSNWDSRRLNVREEVHPCEPLRPGPAFSMYSRPSTDSPKGFQLMEHVEQLRNIANKNGLSHETRFDEGSFSFRRGDKLLIFTEFNEEKVRGSWHNSGRIYNERYYPKVDWEMFCATIRGLLCDTFVSLSNMADSRLQLPFESDSSSGSTGSLNGLPSSAHSKKFSWGCPPSFDNREKFVEWGTPPDFARENPKTRGNSFVSPLARKWVLPEVPDKFRTGGGAPFPLFKRTVDGRAFLCFFTKVYAFSNHHPAVFRIEDSLFCCSEQYYMWRKTKHFGFDRAAEEIMEMQHAGTIKRLGTADTLRERRRIGMEPNSREFDHDEWREVKEEIMLTALRAKFTQNAKMLRMLVDTCDAVLVEASPTDTYWGVGRAIDSEEIEDPQKWRGTNRLGILLQRLRMELQYS